MDDDGMPDRCLDGAGGAFPWVVIAVGLMATIALWGYLITITWPALPVAAVLVVAWVGVRATRPRGGGFR